MITLSAGPHRLVANPAIVLREEFDDWAILFDPDSGVRSVLTLRVSSYGNSLTGIAQTMRLWLRSARPWKACLMRPRTTCAASLSLFKTVGWQATRTWPERSPGSCEAHRGGRKAVREAAPSHRPHVLIRENNQNGRDH